MRKPPKFQHLPYIKFFQFFFWGEVLKNNPNNQKKPPIPLEELGQGAPSPDQCSQDPGAVRGAKKQTKPIEGCTHQPGAAKTMENHGVFTYVHPFHLHKTCYFLDIFGGQKEVFEESCCCSLRLRPSHRSRNPFFFVFFIYRVLVIRVYIGF